MSDRHSGKANNLIMKDFVLIFRNSKDDPTPSPEQLQASMTEWINWMGGIAAQNKMTDKGNRLSSSTGKSIRGNVVTDGPYTEIKEFISGYIIVKADSIEEAVEHAKGCPALKRGGVVEIRTVVSMDDNS